MQMQGQDWDRVVVSKTSGGGGGSGVPGNAVHTSAGPFKCKESGFCDWAHFSIVGAGKNQQRGMQMNSLKVDEETEELSREFHSKNNIPLTFHLTLTLVSLLLYLDCY